jgi:hypothetical protein
VAPVEVTRLAKRALALQQRRNEDAQRLRALRAMVDKGVAALDRGDFVEIDDLGLDAFMRSITPTRRRRR